MGLKELLKEVCGLRGLKEELLKVETEVASASFARK
jgi:hypothetical protein